MGIPCPGCGRQYDVTLFQFGRTIHCTCGIRVGMEARTAAGPPPAEIRFMADAMLGRLARWLRVMGYDTGYEPDIDDALLVRRAIEEDRVILTRDRALPEEWRAARIFVLDSEAPLEQLRRVAEHFHLEWRERLFRRCSVCNTELAPISRDQARERVPARVAREHDRFAECPWCAKVYWEGSHTRRMRRVLEQTLGESARNS